LGGKALKRNSTVVKFVYVIWYFPRYALRNQMAGRKRKHELVHHLLTALQSTINISEENTIAVLHIGSLSGIGVNRLARQLG